MSKALDAFVARANKKFGEGTVVRGSEIIEPMVPRITSGSLAIDVVLGGGWVTNNWTTVFGWESSGKTALVLLTIKANQELNPDFEVIWVAAEDFNEHYADMIGVDRSRIQIVPTSILEECCDLVLDALEHRVADMIVIDSLPALVTEKEDEDGLRSNHPGLRARVIGDFFAKANPRIKRSLIKNDRPIAAIIINQWRETFTQYGDSRTTPGGNAKDFWFVQAVEVQRSEWIRNTKKEPIGQVIKIVNKKNKSARPGLVGQIDFYVAGGRGFKAGDVDVVKDIKSAALAYEVVERRGAWYYFGSGKWNGEDALEKAIRSSAKLRAAIRAKVLAVGAPMMEQPSEPVKKRAAKKVTAKKQGAARRG